MRARRLERLHVLGAPGRRTGRQCPRGRGAHRPPERGERHRPEYVRDGSRRGRIAGAGGRRDLPRGDRRRGDPQRAARAGRRTREPVIATGAPQGCTDPTLLEALTAPAMHGGSLPTLRRGSSRSSFTASSRRRSCPTAVLALDGEQSTDARVAEVTRAVDQRVCPSATGPHARGTVSESVLSRG